jgi:hypothetical protein
MSLKVNEFERSPLMKQWQAHKTVGIAASILLVLAGTISWLLSKPATISCASDMPARSNVHTIRATKVVVQPWKGRHQVYGIFIVHNQYKDLKKYSATLSIQGFDGEFSLGESIRSQYVMVNPEFDVFKGYIPTRVALWLLLAGQFEYLRAPCSWKLDFTRRS